MSLILNYVLGGILASLAAYYVVRFLFRVDERIEDYKRAAIQLASQLSRLGLVQIPGFLISFSVNDFSDMGEKIKDLAKLFLNGNAGVLEEFHEVYERVLDAKLKTPEGRALIAAKLAESEPVTAVN